MASRKSLIYDANALVRPTSQVHSNREGNGFSDLAAFNASASFSHTFQTTSFQPGNGTYRQEEITLSCDEPKKSNVSFNPIRTLRALPPRTNQSLRNPPEQLYYLFGSNTEEMGGSADTTDLNSSKNVTTLNPTILNLRSSFSELSFRDEESVDRYDSGRDYDEMSDAYDKIDDMRWRKADFSHLSARPISRADSEATYLLDLDQEQNPIPDAMKANNMRHNRISEL
ncbi:unnamed protein product, partial [Protopolystoma xenopodis]